MESFARCLLVLLAALVITPLAQITMRGIFNVPMSGAEELARYFLICMTFLAAAYVTQQGGQIRMEEFQAVLADPAHPEHAERLDWVGGQFDPHHFDLDDTDRALQWLAWRPLTPVA